jgi:beta-phosphoglucomutase-like phosphatase (HAD superfamily)
MDDIQGVIFDLDGLLLDSEGVWDEGRRSVARSNSWGRPKLDQEVWSPFGHYATRESVTLLDTQ